MAIPSRGENATPTCLCPRSPGLAPRLPGWLLTGGIIFAYMGPGDPPLLPKFEALSAPEEQLFMRKMFQDSNYLNSLEGSQDPGHTSFLHKQLGEDEESRRALRFAVKGVDAAPSLSEAWKQDLAPTVEVDQTDFSIHQLSVRRLGPEQSYVWISPGFCPMSSPPQVPPEETDIHLPDMFPSMTRRAGDTASTSGAVARWIGKPSTASLPARWEPVTADPQQGESLFARQRANEDRLVFGFGPQITMQDVAITDVQGQVQDRTREHLGYADQVITAARRMALKAVRELQDGP